MKEIDALGIGDAPKGVGKQLAASNGAKAKRRKARPPLAAVTPKI